MNISTAKSLKDKAAVIRKFLKEKYNVDISHGHSLEVTSKVFGFKDWNTASAALQPNRIQKTPADQIVTVGDMKEALEAFDESAIIDACYDFKVKEFEVDSLAHPEDEIYQEFSLSLGSSDNEFVSFKLKLEHESMMTSFYSRPLQEDCDCIKSRAQGEK